MGRKKTGKYITCPVCKTVRYITVGRLKEGAKYCSRKCSGLGHSPWNKGLTKNDDERLMSISKKASEQMHKEYNNGTRDRFDITKKANEAIRNIGMKRFLNSPNKIISKRGYIEIYIPQKGWVKEHHYIWEKINGAIPNGHIIHHINKNRLDNKIENLQLMTSSEHGKLHYKDMEIDSLGRFVSSKE